MVQEEAPYTASESIINILVIALTIMIIFGIFMLGLGKQGCEYVADKLSITVPLFNTKVTPLKSICDSIFPEQVKAVK